MFFLSKPGINLLEKSLDASTLRQKVIANNMANIDTPHFKRSEVVFEDLLQKEIQSQGGLQAYRTDPRHLRFHNETSGNVMPQIIQDNNTSMNNNQNNVDIDYEMSLMAKNQLRYNVLVQQMNSEFKKMRTAIEGRRG